MYDYAWGKADWLAAGLPTQGAGTRERRAIDAIEEALTCPPTTTVRDATERAQAADADNLLVINEEGILLGRFRLDTVADPEAVVDSLSEPGPVTVRANEPLEPMLERMARRGVTEMVVTTPEGRLLGVVRRPR